MKRLLILLALTLAVMPVAGLSLTFQDAGDFVANGLVNGRCYNVSGSKTGYSSASYLKCVEGV